MRSFRYAYATGPVATAFPDDAPTHPSGAFGMSGGRCEPMADTAILRVTDETTPEELREAITNLAATAARLPAHWTDRKDKLHDRINTLLDELAVVTALDASRPCD